MKHVETNILSTAVRLFWSYSGRVKNRLTLLSIFSRIYIACSEGKSFVGNGWLDKATD